MNKYTQIRIDRLGDRTRMNKKPKKWMRSKNLIHHIEIQYPTLEWAIETANSIRRVNKTRIEEDMGHIQKRT